MVALHLYSLLVCPPRPAKQASTADSKMNFLDPVGRAAAHPVSYCPTSILPTGKQHPMRISSGVMQTVFLRTTCGKQTLKALFLKVTRLMGRAGGWTDCARVSVKCKEKLVFFRELVRRLVRHWLRSKKIHNETARVGIEEFLNS